MDTDVELEDVVADVEARAPESPAIKTLNSHKHNIEDRCRFFFFFVGVCPIKWAFISFPTYLTVIYIYKFQFLNDHGNVHMKSAVVTLTKKTN